LRLATAHGDKETACVLHADSPSLSVCRHTTIDPGFGRFSDEHRNPEAAP
jgi:hypothetical protein